MTSRQSMLAGPRVSYAHNVPYSYNDQESRESVDVP
jgi:hypothetical protein